MSAYYMRNCLPIFVVGDDQFIFIPEIFQNDDKKI